MTKISVKTRILSLTLVFVLLAAMALTFVSCDKENEVGQGEISFAFNVTLPDGTVKEYTVKTDKSKVGDALLEEGLIAGEKGAYGLYVKTVDGVTLDYDEDGMYWSFYIDGEYAMTGVDMTKIEEGRIYSFKAEAAQ